MKNIARSAPKDREATPISLEEIYRTFHSVAYLGLDPLICVRKQTTQHEQEIVGLIAAVLSYGRVESIIAIVDRIVAACDGQVGSVIQHETHAAFKKRFMGFYHRFNDDEDIALLCVAIKKVLRLHGSIGAFFTQCWHSHNNMATAMAHFCETFRNIAALIHGSRKKSFEFFFPSPFAKSACKRLNMYFRWMVRPDDGIDLGVWSNLDPTILIAPMDAHVCAQAERIGLLTHTSATWAHACELTQVYACFDKADPVKYDFSLCRYGMVSLRKGTHGNLALPQGFSS